MNKVYWDAKGKYCRNHLVKLITLFWKSNWLHEKEKEAIVEGNPWFWFSRPCPNWRSRLWGESLPLSGHNYNTTWVGSDGHCVAARWHRAPSAPGLDTTPGQACSIHTPPSPSSPPPPPSPPLVHWCIQSNSSQELAVLKWCTGCTGCTPSCGPSLKRYWWARWSLGHLPLPLTHILNNTWWLIRCALCKIQTLWYISNRVKYHRFVNLWQRGP